MGGKSASANSRRANVIVAVAWVTPVVCCTINGDAHSILLKAIYTPC